MTEQEEATEYARAMDAIEEERELASARRWFNLGFQAGLLQAIDDLFGSDNRREAIAALAVRLAADRGDA